MAKAKAEYYVVTEGEPDLLYPETTGWQAILAGIGKGNFINIPKTDKSRATSALHKYGYTGKYKLRLNTTGGLSLTITDHVR